MGCDHTLSMLGLGRIFTRGRLCIGYGTSFIRHTHGVDKGLKAECDCKWGNRDT